jgi:nitroreductase
MDTIELLLRRRSVLAVSIIEPGPDDAALDTILRAATRVPDHGKLTPWRIQVLRKAGQRRLGDLLAKLFAAKIPEANARQIEFERQRPQRAPLLLVVTSKIRKNHKIPEMEQRLSGGAVCMSILIAASALGHAAQWLTEWPAYNSEVTRALGHDPETDQIIGFIYLGTAAEPPAERPRPALEDVVSEWGNAASPPS